MTDFVIPDNMSALSMSAEMVRALLAGTKTQTRRIPKVPIDPAASADYHLVDTNGKTLPNHYGKPGSILYVREDIDSCCEREDITYSADHASLIDIFGDELRYRAESPRKKEWQLRPEKTPAKYMPKWCARIFLRHISQHVERLQSITEADAIAEGVERRYAFCHGGDDASIVYQNYCDMRQAVRSPITSFATLIDKIHGHSTWDSNPHVRVIKFEVIHVRRPIESPRSVRTAHEPPAAQPQETA